MNNYSSCRVRGIVSLVLLLVVAACAETQPSRFYMLSGMGAPVASEQTFSDYRDVAGCKLPFKSVTIQDGKKAQESTASDIKINVQVSEEQFSVKD